jgi:rod shape-determining protein MreC
MLPGKKYSIVLPVLNGRSSISCKISGSNSFGFLEWYGGNPYMAYIVDMPFHTDVNPGDTVVTSGFSSAFPENIPVGIVESVEEEQLNYMLRLTVSLFADMSDIRWVYVNTHGQDPEPEELKEELQ